MRSPLPVVALGSRPLGVGTLRALRRVATGADVVVAYGSTTLPACAIALLGSPVPFVYRSIGDPSRWVRGEWHRRITGLQFRRAARVVALWEDARLAVTRLYDVPPEDAVVIPNARDPEEFCPASSVVRARARAELGIKAGEQRVVTVIGSLTPEKRVALAIAVVAQMPGYVMLVVGDGPQRAELMEQAARQAPGRVTFLGVVEDIRPVLSATDVLLIASSTEGMPGAAIEALLCGVPVVSTNVGALRELPGVTIVSADPRDLARAVASSPGPSVVLDHRLAGYCWQAVVPQWSRLLGRIASTRRAPNSHRS